MDPILDILHRRKYGFEEVQSVQMIFYTLIIYKLEFCRVRKKNRISKNKQNTTTPIMFALCAMIPVFIYLFFYLK